jgi:hypothetical protein
MNAQSKSAPVAQDNVLLRLKRGESVPKIVRKNKETAKIGNLFFEYVQDTSLRDYGINSYAVADALMQEGLIDVNYETGWYTWRGTPMTKGEFLTKFGPREARIAQIAK